MIVFIYEDDENYAGHDDPHKALKAINLDDLDSIPAYVPFDTTKDQIGDILWYQLEHRQVWNPNRLN